MLPKRKQNRLQNYDYGKPGYYFITICTKNKAKILCDVVGGDAHIAPQIQLSPYGAVVEKYVRRILGIDKYVIMPNHIHMIIRIDGPMWASAPTQGIPQIVKSFKTLVTKHIGTPLFQRSFHDHIIRNEPDCERIRHYIDRNPAKWERDCFYIP